jgi:hypothetical protein
MVLTKHQHHANIIKTMKFVTQKIHAFLDYPVAVALMALPFLLGLGETNALALQLSVATGAAAFLLTVLTNHELGMVRVVPYKVHLMVDFAVALVFIAAPFIFGFEGIDAWFYWINGAAVLTVVSLHKAEPEPATAA